MPASTAWGEGRYGYTFQPNENLILDNVAYGNGATANLFPSAAITPYEATFCKEICGPMFTDCNNNIIKYNNMSKISTWY